MPFPAPPWQLRGEMLLSVWRLGGGLVGMAFIDYRPGSTLVYRELLLARLAGPGPSVRITDIWVDSPASRDGGRALWAIPKELADFTLGDGRWEARAGGRLLAAAGFQARRGLPAVRVPVRLRVRQPRDGGVVSTPVRGTAGVRPVRARWDIPDDGPLGELAGPRPLVSVLLSDVRLRVGD